MISCPMRGSVLVLGIACLLACATPASSGCEPIEGIQELLAPGRVLVLGELHGTVESPAFAGDVACHAAGAGLDFVVALELSPAASFPVQTAEMLQPFQGSWQAYQYGSKAWTIEIKEQRFRGVLGPDDWYEGQIRLRPDRDPAEIDFMIEKCRCSYRGMTSQGIFRLNGESIVLAAPTPGSSRPEAFNANDGRMVELKRIQTKKPE